jgi:hypothetical protein
MMTDGEKAYREDVARRSAYPDGQPRRDWSELDDLIRSTWERNPTARDWGSNETPYAEDLCRNGVAMAECECC